MSHYLFTNKQNTIKSVKTNVNPLINSNTSSVIKESFSERFKNKANIAKKNTHFNYISNNCSNCDNFIIVKFNISHNSNNIDFVVDQMQNLILDGENVEITKFIILGLSMKEININNYNTLRHFKFTINKNIYNTYKSSMQIFFWLKINNTKYMCKGIY